MGDLVMEGVHRGNVLWCSEVHGEAGGGGVARGVVLLPPSLHLRDALREAERHVVHLGGHKAGGLQCRIDLTRAGYGFAALVRLAAQLRLMLGASLPTPS